MNRHRRARWFRLIDTINRELGWLIEPLFAVALGAALGLLAVEFLDIAIRAGRL